MSSRTSSLLIILLCISFCSFNARPIGVINKENETMKTFHFSSKTEEKSSLARVSISSNVKPSILKKSEEAKEDSSLMENRVKKDNHATRADQKLVEKKYEAKDDHKRPKVETDVVQIESLANVSWKLPHVKRGEQQPGFNLDYAPPKTHPPVHN